MIKTEDRIQQEIVIWYNNKYCLPTNEPNRGIIYHVPNQNQHQLKHIGVLAGVSDLVVIHNRIHHYIEIKTPTGTQSPKQLEFQNRVANLGYTYKIIRSLNEFQLFIVTL